MINFLLDGVSTIITSVKTSVKKSAWSQLVSLNISALSRLSTKFLTDFES